MRTGLSISLVLLAALVMMGSVPLAPSYATVILCTPPPSGMVSWWPGDDNAEDIQGGNDGTLQNGATFGAGKVDQAFTFDGVDDFVNVPNAANIDLLNDFTIDAWVKPESFSDFQNVLFKSSASGPSFAQYGIIVPSTGIWRAQTSDSSDTAGGQLVIGEWSHVAFTFSGGVVTTYHNGALVGSTSGNLISTQGTPLTIGADVANVRFLDGQVDEVEIFNRVLSQAEIQAIFDAGSAGKCHYSLNLFENGDPSDLVYDLGQEARAVAETDDPVVTQVEFRWIDPSANIETEFVLLTLGSAESTFTPDEVGMWTVEADFGNGVVVRKTLDIDFFVVPESSIGIIALIGSSLAALGVFVLLRRKHGNNHSYTIGDLGI